MCTKKQWEGMYSCRHKCSKAGVHTKSSRIHKQIMCARVLGTFKQLDEQGVVVGLDPRSWLVLCLP